MLKVTLLVAVGLCVLVAPGCVVAPVVPPLAGVYTGIQAPLDVDFKDTKIGLKKGESSSMCILGLVAVGDASTHEAARQGGVKVIQGADYSYTNVLGIYQAYKTIVYGD